MGAANRTVKWGHLDIAVGTPHPETAGFERNLLEE